MTLVVDESSLTVLMAKRFWENSSGRRRSFPRCQPVLTIDEVGELNSMSVSQEMPVWPAGPPRSLPDSGLGTGHPACVRCIYFTCRQSVVRRPLMRTLASPATTRLQGLASVAGAAPVLQLKLAGLQRRHR